MSSDEAVLTYFDGRGRAEIIRLMLTAAGVPFRDGEYLREREQMTKLIDGGKLLFNQVPLLEIDGKQLVQTNSIIRYIARRQNMFGNTPDEQVQIDMLFEGTRDFIMAAFYPLKAQVFGFTKTDEEILESARNTSIPKYLPVYEKTLKEHGGKYLVGDSLSYADIGLLENLFFVEECLGLETLNTYPLTQKYFQDLKSLEKIDLYLKTIRKGPANDEYFGEVVRALGFTK